MNKHQIFFLMVTWISVLPSFAQLFPKLKPLSDKELLEILEPMEKKGKWGYANVEGKFFIKPIFSAARPYKKEAAIVCYEGKWGLLDKRGIWAASPVYEEMGNFEGSYSIVKQNGVYGTMGYDGKHITEPMFQKCERRNGFNVLLVEKNGQWGAVDKQGELSVQPIFSEVDVIKNGIALVTQDGRRGAVNAELKTVVVSNYDSLAYAADGALLAKKDYLMGVISYQGEVKIPLEYEDIHLSQSGKSYIVKQNGKYGLKGTNYKEILPPVLREEPKLQSGNSLIQQDSLLYIVSEKGAGWWYVPIRFDLSNLSSVVMPDISVCQAMRLGTDMLLVYEDNTPYFLVKDDRVVWAANSAVKQWAETPINYRLNCETVSRKGLMTALNVNKRSVQIEQSFELSWPISSVDPRVDVTICQQALLDAMSKHLFGESFATSFETVDEFLAYATTHACKSENLTNIRSVNLKQKMKNTTPGSYSMVYIGEFVGDEESADVTYDFHPNIESYDMAHPENEPYYIHFNKASGETFQLKDRFTLNAQSRMVGLMRNGRVELTNDDREIFKEVKDECADVDENFFMKDGLLYFYKHPFYSCPPIHIGLRMRADVRGRKDRNSDRHLESEYVFTSPDLDFWGLHGHVRRVVVTEGDSVTCDILFSIDGRLERVNGSDESGFYKRNKRGYLIKEKKDEEAYIYMENDTEGNWIKRRKKDGLENDIVIREITYY